MTTPDLALFPVSQFYYKDVLGNLVIGLANGAVSNGVRKQLSQGTLVLNYAKDNESGRYFAQVGISTGEVLNERASDLWPTWTNDNPVFVVQWITGQVNVPAELFANQQRSLPNDDVREAITYVVLNN